MKVQIDVAFEGYPDGGHEPSRHFAVGEEVDVSDEFGANIIGKQLAHAAGAAAPQQQVIHEAE